MKNRRAHVEGTKGWYFPSIQKLIGPLVKDSSLSAAGGAFLIDLVDHLYKSRPAGEMFVVADLGMGLSTVLLAEWRASAGDDAIIWSVDHNAPWVEAIGKLLVHAGIASPLVELHLQADVEGLEPVGCCDVVVVDQGPSYAARVEQLDWELELLRPEGVIVFDDWPSVPKSITRRNYRNRLYYEARIKRRLARFGTWDVAKVASAGIGSHSKTLGIARRASPSPWVVPGMLPEEVVRLTERHQRSARARRRARTG